MSVFQVTFQINGFSGKRLMKGNMSATNTDLPSTRDAISTDADTGIEIPVPLIMSARMKATMCRMIKKNKVGGIALRASSFIVCRTAFILIP
ncbi:hypothetical protein D3C87_1657300 [compost metagenome]